MTATGRNRLASYAAMFAALVAAIMMTSAVQAKQASAADPVGNPGTFTATFNSGSTQYGNQTFNSSGSFTMNVAANGTFTVSSITFPGQGAPNVSDGGSVELREVVLTPQTTGAWSGTINPLTGAMSMSGPLQVHLFTGRYGYFGIVTNTQSNGTCIASTPATVSPSGSNYNFNTGTVNLSQGSFTGGGASDCRARSGIIGGSTKDMNGHVNSAYGMNGSGNSINWGLTIRNGANQPVRPWPVRPTFTVSPNPVGVGDTVTFNASGSAIDNGVQTCAGPSPSDPNCGYRWDFDGNGTIDAVTNGPTVTHTYSAPANETPKLTIFDTTGRSDTYTGAIWVQSKPVAQINSNPPAVTKETVNQFTFSIPANPYGATTQCSIDGAAFSACNSGANFTFAQAADTIGNHNFRVRGITPGGVAGPAAQYNFTIDRVWPRVTIDPDSVPADPTNVTSAAFEFTADKPGSTLDCRIDGGSWEACGSSSTGNQNYAGLTENPDPHVFEVRATDPIGNVGSSSFNWRVDLTRPVITFDVVPGNQSVPGNPSDDTQPSISWINDEPVQNAQCRLNRGIGMGAWGTCDSLTTHQVGVPTALADGQYTIQVRTLDIAGNWSDVTEYTWQVETINPNIEIVRAPAEHSARSLAFFDFEFEAGAEIRCQIDSEPEQDPCTANLWNHPTDPGLEMGRIGYAGLAEGPHSFTVIARDAASNETAQVYAWSVKTTEPAVTLDTVAVPDSVSTSADATFTFATANGDAECRLDGGSWEACDSNTGQSYTGLADGSHTFEVKATDEAGSESAPEVYSWQILGNAPGVSFDSAPAADTNSTSATFAFSVDSADPDVAVTCSLDGGSSFDCGSPTSVTALADGAHNFTVTAVDAAGQSESASHDWNVKAAIPELAFSQAPAAISNSASATFAFSSNEGGDVECRLDGGSWSSCSSPTELSGLGEGVHSFEIRSTDGVGNTGSAAHDWTVDTTAPNVTVSSGPSGSTESVAEVVEFSSNESAVTYSCKLDGGSASACSSPHLLKNLSVGAHTLEIQATDAAGNTGPAATLNWTVTQRIAPEPVSGQSGTIQSGSTQSGSTQAAVTRVGCPAALRGPCVVTMQAYVAGKPVSTIRKVRVKRGTAKRVKLRIRKVNRSKVTVRQKIRSKRGKKLARRTSGKVIGS